MIQIIKIGKTVTHYPGDKFVQCICKDDTGKEYETEISPEELAVIEAIDQLPVEPSDKSALFSIINDYRRRSYADGYSSCEESHVGPEY